MFETIRVAFLNLGANRMRTGLTMLGVTIGVAAVIILVSVGQAFETYVQEQFQSVGVNLIFIVPTADDRGQVMPLTLNDAEALANLYNVPDASVVMPHRNVRRTIKFGSREVERQVQGVDTSYLQLFNREIAAGRFIDERDLDTSARVAVVEQGLVDTLMPDVYPVGQSIRVGDVRFTVIGVLGQQGSSIFGGGSGIIVPITTVQTRLSGERVLSGERPITFISAQARASNLVDDVVDEITQTLRAERDISFRDSDDFVVFTQSEIIDTLASITGLITVFLAILAGISLLVGGIGITNIMLVTVTERTREIGLRKAVGAQKSAILLQFLTEAVVLSLIGGSIGVLIAIGFGALVSRFQPELQVQVQLSSVLLATVISVVVGVLSGGYPAQRAANLNPIDALRYE
ncbi:MAG: ABC transporter permease [Anaerolineae bacterium]|nr:ABC transporter permease [Anaerolineae bacterium]